MHKVDIDHPGPVALDPERRVLAGFENSLPLAVESERAGAFELDRLAHLDTANGADIDGFVVARRDRCSNAKSWLVGS